MKYHEAATYKKEKIMKKFFKKTPKWIIILSGIGAVFVMGILILHGAG